ncbi:hypothetical protein [Bifidobacterium sp. SO1]|uniref:hypothetical protein n=1 Tax=Bifidobacterium sp. SO1 TaxID=2809029 RepID=UPI001BDD76DF|nr:hypothetical protein [Bifidobacterium sp. SO1]MBT1162784.1 hypothetical protein [Bifidobacterium sp. SO1]
MTDSWDVFGAFLFAMLLYLANPIAMLFWMGCEGFRYRPLPDDGPIIRYVHTTIPLLPAWMGAIVMTILFSFWLSR